MEIRNLGLFDYIILFERMEQCSHAETLRLLAQDPLLTNYHFLQVVGEGCFGKIVKVRNKSSSNVTVLKLESLRKTKFRPILKNEIEILKKLQGVPGVPRLVDYGKWGQGLFL